MNMVTSKVVLPEPEPQTSESRVFVTGLELVMSIGAYEVEKTKKQRVLADIELTVQPNPAWRNDDLGDVVSYDDIIQDVKEIAKEGHLHLLETLGEKIISRLFEYDLVKSVSVKLIKPDMYEGNCRAGVSMHKERTLL